MTRNKNESSEGAYPEYIIKIHDVELVNTKHIIYLHIHRRMEQVLQI